MDDKNGTTETVTYTYGIDDFYSQEAGRWNYVYFRNLNVNDLRETMRITVYENDKAISATYEVNGAAAAKAKVAANPALTDLVNAMMNYADCAKALFG